MVDSTIRPQATSRRTMILRAVSSLVSLLILTVIFGVVQVLLAVRHLHLSAEWQIGWSLLSRLFIACWVWLDRRNRVLSLPFDFEAFVFFAWPFFLPYYLYKSRGARRGIFVTVVTFFVLIFVPALATTIIRVI